MKKIILGCLIAAATLVPQTTLADTGVPVIEGTWSITIRGLVHDMVAKSKKLSPVSTSATMKITQVDAGRLYIEIEGTTGVLDGWTATPDFQGEGIVGNSTWVASECASSTEFSQTIHGTVTTDGNALSGEWWIVDTRTTAAGFVVVQFAGSRISTSDPGIAGCP